MPPGSGILNVSSTAAGRDDPATAAYAAGKSYLETLSRAARQEGVEHSIQVTVVRPGRTSTAFTPTVRRDADPVVGAPDVERQQLAEVPGSAHKGGGPGRL